MTLTDLSVIYLAFGAPIAVYKYLQNRTANIGRRTAVSVLTFFFWIPAAIEIGYLHLANAYFKDAFVSQGNIDALNRRIHNLRESITTELIQLNRGSSIHDTRETVDRYTGLADAVRNQVADEHGGNELFEAAGRNDYELGQLSLMRRNLRRLKRHHILARRDFINLLDQSTRRSAGSTILAMGTELARQLEDQETVEELKALEIKRGEVWTSVQQEQSQSITPASIVMTASLNND
jgi:hypothetical protein